MYKMQTPQKGSEIGYMLHGESMAVEGDEVRSLVRIIQDELKKPAAVRLPTRAENPDKHVTQESRAE